MKRSMIGLLLVAFGTPAMASDLGDAVSGKVDKTVTSTQQSTDSGMGKVNDKITSTAGNNMMTQGLTTKVNATGSKTKTKTHTGGEKVKSVVNGGSAAAQSATTQKAVQ